MPDVERAGFVKNRLEPHARRSQPQSQVVVLLAPALKPLVEPVDPFEVSPPDAEVAPRQPRLCGMTDDCMPAGPTMPAGQESSLLGRDQVGQIQSSDASLPKTAAGSFRQPASIAEQSGPRTSALAMGG